MDTRNPIPGTELAVSPLCLGGNTFGWTTDREQSFAVLDAYREAGGNFIDTADSYSAWVEGNTGGESETIIGEWLAARGSRSDVVLGTKVGRQPGLQGLSRRVVLTALEASLRRLRTDCIDLYYVHVEDPDTPVEETLETLASQVQAGKVRHIAASNHGAEALGRALAVSDERALPRFVALQPHYNLMERAGYEGPLQELAAREHLACMPYYALASGFLTGKYRPGAAVGGPRAGAAGRYLTPRGERVLHALDGVAAAHETVPAAVALAWLAGRPTVTAPVASARTPEQLATLLDGVTLRLTDDERAALDAASAEAPTERP